PRLALMDLYSVGSLAFHIATGRPAYDREKITAAAGNAWFNGQMKAPRIDAYVPGCPPGVADLIANWVSLDPGDRLGVSTPDVSALALVQLRDLRETLTSDEAHFVVGRDRVVASYSSGGGGRHRSEETPVGSGQDGEAWESVPHQRPMSSTGVPLNEAS